ncbi:MAG: hypothetical protein IT223_00790 [Crocinitomicaceae bacterium]|nr:hypothetical protein [Crocinitomicaceae bacterium]
MKHSIVNVLRTFFTGKKYAETGFTGAPKMMKNLVVLPVAPLQGRKRYLKSLWMASAILLLAGSMAFGQELPVANVSSTGVLQISADQPLNGSYHFDLSQFQFDSDNAMTDFLSNKSGDSFIVRALPHLNKGVLMLQLENHPSWTVDDWNAYLNTATTLNPILP